MFVEAHHRFGKRFELPAGNDGFGFPAWHVVIGLKNETQLARQAFLQQVAHNRWQQVIAFFSPGIAEVGDPQRTFAYRRIPRRVGVGDGKRMKEKCPELFVLPRQLGRVRVEEHFPFTNLRLKGLEGVAYLRDFLSAIRRVFQRPRVKVSAKQEMPAQAGGGLGEPEEFEQPQKVAVRNRRQESHIAGLQIDLFEKVLGIPAKRRRHALGGP